MAPVPEGVKLSLVVANLRETHIRAQDAAAQ
jgi:hypothetical protein